MLPERRHVAASLLLGASLLACSDKPTERDVNDRIAWRAAVGPLVSDRAPVTSPTGVYVATILNKLIALDKRNGQTRWTRQLAGSGLLVRPGSLLTAGSLLIASDLDGGHAFAENDGNPAWSYSASGESFTGGVMTTDGATLYAVSSIKRLHAIDVSSGTHSWDVDLQAGDLYPTEARVGDGLVAVGLSSFAFGSAPTSGAVVVVEAATGEERWRYTFPTSDPGRSTGCCWTGAVFAPGVVIVATDDGWIHALHATSGTLQWSAPGVGGANVVERDPRPLALVSGRLVAGSKLGTLMAYDPATGQQQWRADPGGAGPTGPIASSGGRVYLTYFTAYQPPLVLAGSLVSFDVLRGELLWATDGPLAFLTPAADELYVYAPTVAGLLALEK